jgi:hypothetical protein
MNGGTLCRALTLSALSPAGPELAALTSIVERPALDHLLGACLLDLTSSVMALSGVSFTIAAASPSHAEEIRGIVPAGVNLIALEPTVDGATAEQVFLHRLSQESDRTVIVSGDTVALPAATAGTAFGVLESADLVVGPTRDAQWYLLGLGNGAAIDAALAAGGRTDALLDLAAQRRLVMRRMEPRVRLAGIDSSDALESLRQIPGLGPRVSAWLSERFDTA